MKKVLVAFISIVLIGLLCTGCPTDPNDSNSGGTSDNNLTDISMLTELEKATIAAGTFYYAGYSELYYAFSTDDVPGMSGTVGTSIQWNNFDWGAIDSTDDIATGEVVIVSGTHVISESGTTLNNSMDITIRFNTEDAPVGTFRVVYVTRTPDYETEGATEEVVTFTVNGSNVNLSLLPD